LTILYLVGAKNTDNWCAKKGDLQCASPLGILMVSSSSIAITSDGECLACSRFFLGKPILLGNLEFITHYFAALSLSPRRGNEGAIFMGSTHSGASTLQRATIGESTKEFLTVSSREGSFGHPSPRRCSTGASFATTTTATWKVMPQPKTNHPFERHHVHRDGQPMQAHAQHPTTEPGSVSRRSHLIGKQTTSAVQPDALPQREPALETKRIHVVELTPTQA
jgi:hypothetical protein